MASNGVEAKKRNPAASASQKQARNRTAAAKPKIEEAASGKAALEEVGEAEAPTKGRRQEKTKTKKGSGLSLNLSSGLADQIDLLLGVTSTTSLIVQQAASILEEELAAGIVTANQVEEMFVDVQKLRTGDETELMQRFRHDAHEIVDILIDLVTLTTNSLGELSQRVDSVRGDTRAENNSTKAEAGQPSSRGIPSLTVPQIVRPGQFIEVPLSLENDSDKATESFHFLSSDLMNASGERIAARQISFVPASLAIGPHNSATITVQINVPQETMSGIYSGLLQASKLEHLRAVLMVRVESSSDESSAS